MYFANRGSTKRSCLSTYKYIIPVYAVKSNYNFK
ncbi:hypothetical protein GECvBN5_gp122 [Salmonella phage GEC_vB_N5]|uniref:Uncharacterized protein n=2 Tax=Markadamsvirinae TaxID=2732013 RepID=A0A7S9SS01_9CAUD|nr:hypothetical protein GECvBN3_gp125 [Salmonella phage GEC_vB_N3]QPI15138.1 hypothetical protein GECvBN5_gp122 [Salmonella phage GEC_vB_N5]